MKVEWITITNKEDMKTYQEMYECFFPLETDSDLTYQMFKEETPDKVYILNINRLTSCWVSLFIDPENPKIVTNLSVVIFEKSTVFKSLRELIKKIKEEYDEVSFFTVDNTTTDKIINKMNKEFDNNLFQPVLKNINLYKYKK